MSSHAGVSRDLSCLVPLSSVESCDLEPLLDEEAGRWREALHWDFSKTARLILQYAAGGLIAGAALRCGGKVAGYGYYLLRHTVGCLGGIYVSPARADPAEGSGAIFSRMFGELRRDFCCRRVEGQFFTLTHCWQPVLQNSGVSLRRRHYMVRGLENEAGAVPGGPVRAWDNGYLSAAARLLFSTYAGHPDRELSEAYQSREGCTEFLHHIVFVPGCGDFVPRGSAVYLDARGELGGFILASAIAGPAALIPQLCVRPDLQGRGVGTLLLQAACRRLREEGFLEVFLCVTEDNGRARELYLRRGFRDVQAFAAFFWNRSGTDRPARVDSPSRVP